MDAINRQAAIDAITKWEKTCVWDDWCDDHRDESERYHIIPPSTVIRTLPSAQPDIIRCRNCKFASGDSRICMKFGHSPIGELDFCAWAERRTDGKERGDNK